MSTYKKILVAVDSSDEAVEVLEAAKGLPGIQDAEVSVVHVAQHPQAAYGQWVVYLPVSERQLQEQLLEKLGERVAKSGLQVASTRVEFGRAIDEILNIAKSDGSDLIVIGSHGRHGIKLILGSTANGVLHRAECDVLAVRVSE
ncbi:MAG: universal stress protein [Halieaceae bacterium]|jgi:universal stress protein A|nr:universal stress protein [Halieaceae bacterium]